MGEDTAGTTTRGATKRSWESRSLGPVLGAEIIGLDLSHAVGKETFEAIKTEFETHHVLAFRDQSLTHEDLLAFSSRWGPVGGHVQRADAVHTITNADENGKPKGSVPETGALHFHSDKSYMSTPVLATFLYAVEVPPEGGDTVFANTYAAHEALAQDVKVKIDDLYVWHSLEWFSRTSNNPLSREALDQAPPVRHRLVQRDPKSGRKSIYCGNNAWLIDGWSEEESRELLDYLNEFATQPRFTYRHQWRPGDLVVWDNRCTLHAATQFDASKHLRTLYRTVAEVTEEWWHPQA